MADENTQTTQAPATPAVQATPEPSVTATDFAAIEKELEAASANLVSTDVADQIAKAKEEARKEVEKEFATNLKIKEMQEQLEKEKQNKMELERNSAEQLDALKTKLNNAISSQAISTASNPFDKPQSPTPSVTSSTEDMISNMSDEDLKAVEYESFLALRNRVKN